MERWDVTRKNTGWIARDGAGRTKAQGPTKLTAVRNTAAAAKRSRGPVSVRIHKANGRIQEERTYPRSADPRRTKG
jgi:hypothetical protein